MALETDKAYLKKEGIYEHLGAIINRVIVEKPQDAHAMVEVLSRLVKEGKPAVQQEVTEQDIESFAEQVKKCRQLDKAPVDDEGGELSACAVPNLMEEAEMFAWTGVGLGEQESYKVMCSLRNMAAKSNVEPKPSKLRFWGKILGTSADYWIAEAVLESWGEAEEGKMDTPGEPGSNQYAYLYTTDLAGSWEKLPDIKYSQIKAAMLIRRLFTGCPKAKVVTHPYFDGLEEVLLRAQIARITADTVLCPKGVLKRENEEPEEPGGPLEPPQPNEEFSMPLPAELLQKEAWTHMVPGLLKDGRTNPEPPKEEGEFEGDNAEQEYKKYMEKYMQKKEDDPAKDIIRGIAEDGLDWVVKQAGDPTLFADPLNPKNKENPLLKPKSNAVTFVRSLAWPGAVTASFKDSYTNIYIGYGLKAGESGFFPAAPNDIQDEPEDPGEQKEPQGELPQEPVQGDAE